jgi:N-formylmaleamate deformylase
MTTWTRSTIDLSDTQIAYLEFGESGTPLVCAHGLTDNAQCWLRTAQRLADAGYHVVTYDARGHGESSTPASGYTGRDLAGDLIGLIDALGLEQPLLLGHSMGAQTAALAAAGQPELARGLILEDPPWRPAPFQPDEQAIEQWRLGLQQARDHTDEEIVAAEGSAVVDWHPQDLGPWIESKREARPEIFEWFSQPSDWRAILPAIRIPTLLICGDPALGAIVGPETAAEAGELCPNLQIAYIAGAGHSIRRDRFDPYMETMLQFLQHSIAALQP